MALWGLTTFALVTATISVLIKPTGHPTFHENVKRNVLLFSPSQSALLVAVMLLDFMSWRLLNLVDIHAGLAISCHYYFTSGSSGLERKLWWRLTRRTFLIGGTVPLYVTLLRSENSPWIKIMATPLVADSILIELLSLFWDTSEADLGFNRDWPHRTLVVKAANPPTHTHDENKGDADQDKKTEEDRDTPSSAVTPDGLCDRVYGLWSPTAEADDNDHLQSWPPNDSNLRRIFSPMHRAPPGKCGHGHWRCLIYLVTYATTLVIRWPLMFGDLVLITWLLHRDLQPVTLFVADILLDIRLLKDLLTLSYMASIVLLGDIFILVAVRSLFRQLCQYISFLRRIKQWFQDLPRVAPITYKAIHLSQQIITIATVSHFSITLVLAVIPPLSRNTLSSLMELLVIPIFYVTMYMLVCGREKSEKAPADPELQPKADSSPEASPRPNSTPQDHTKDADNDASETRQSANGDRFNILRLGLLISTATIFFLFC
ncbi:hypothetical protein P875_00042770 [Aspergillus parasiticus SU-1]|uniref:Uncharacterized protein n=1 Tax=Aspergillus parasiticus (strain ATCC 56775 / NRRL 5862 / SRRC 143 / SU-1) TaxID=1403190 RepID=A0A0F0I1E4_ASPPU|nr:hypothetical protein P875_00042770 [Aspergillus parasiticus SU-1]